MKITITF